MISAETMRRIFIDWAQALGLPISDADAVTFTAPAPLADPRIEPAEAKQAAGEPEQEGDPCPECSAPVQQEHPEHGGCTCFKSAPCPYCTTTRLFCGACDWLGETHYA